jgi:hypothetical protein
MENRRLDFVIENAGCLLWLAPRSMGGVSPGEFYRIFSDQSEESLQQLVERGAMMPMSLYQDDGYLVRFVSGDLTEQEGAEWTARVRWKLNIPCGRLVVSGCLDEDIEDEISDLKAAKNKGSYWYGCFVDVPAGEYQVEVYSYPPGDLSGGWGQIETPELFIPTAGLEPEPPIDYFRRTRPDEEPPVWIQGEYDETPYVNFLIRLSTMTEDLPAPEFDEVDCLQWEFRKPDICPLGLRSTFSKASA